MEFMIVVYVSQSLFITDVYWLLNKLQGFGKRCDPNVKSLMLENQCAIVGCNGEGLVHNLFIISTIAVILSRGIYHIQLIVLQSFDWELWKVGSDGCIMNYGQSVCKF